MEIRRIVVQFPMMAMFLFWNSRNPSWNSGLGKGTAPENSGLGTGPPNDFQRFRAGEVEFLEQFWSRSRSTDRIFKNPLRSQG
jgi:hypothetical protein